MAFWTYILLCADGQYYTGHTDDLERRIGEHQSGIIKGFTSSRLPVTLVWADYFHCREEAIENELRIKKWSKAKKKALAGQDWLALAYHSKPPQRAGLKSSWCLVFARHEREWKWAGKRSGSAQ